MDGNGTTQKKFKALFLFAGIGAGALGFLDAQVQLHGKVGSFESVGGVDLDPIACRDFERLTRSPSKVADLATMTPEELRAFAGDQAPDVVFMSPPCKGFSGLMSPKKAATKKYQEMNRLAVKGTKLVLDAWGTDGPGLILLENVPRIATRGKALVQEILKLLHTHGYATHKGSHDCGEIGGLAQHRQRFLLVARHAVKVPVFLYQPPKRRVRGCGEVLGTIPLPNDARAGRLHRLPACSMRTWCRLAAIRPGKDWRDIATLADEERPDWKRYHVAWWGSPTPAVAGTGTNSAWGVADVRVTGGPWHNSVLGVVPMDEPFGTVTGRGVVSTGAFAVADVRIGTFSAVDVEMGTENPNRHRTKYHVNAWDRGAFTVTGTQNVSSGAPCVADLRLLKNANHGCYGVVPMHEPAGVVTGNIAPGGSTCSVADVRLREHEGRNWYHHVLRIGPWSQPVGTITAAHHPSGGMPCVADLRLTCKPWQNAGVLGTIAWSQPSYTITSALDLWAGWAAVADPRTAEVLPAAFDGEVRAPVARGDGRRRGRARGAWKGAGYAFVSDPRVPGNPAIEVRWIQDDLDDAPPFVPVIPGRGDGSWHRPLTLLERAALQGLPLTLRGEPLELEGTLSQVSEHVGNAVPVGAATNVAGEMLRTLILAGNGTFMLSSGSGVWVKKNRDGSFPLYLDQQEKRVSKRARRKARTAAATIERASTFESCGALQ